MSDRRQALPHPGAGSGALAPSARAAIILAYVSIFCIGVPLLVFSTGARLDSFWPVEIPRSLSLTVAGWILTITGFGLTAWSMALLRSRGHGLPISHLPPSELVRSGPYAVFRHPIYVGFSLLCLGVALLARSFWTAIFGVPLLVAGWMAYAILYEEPRLVSRFGEAYLVHVSRTPLLFRAPRAVRAFGRWICRIANPWLNRIANRTVAFRLGDLIVVTYGLFGAAGALLSSIVVAVGATAHGLGAVRAGTFVFTMACAIALSSHVFWWLGHARELRREPWFGFGRIGFVSYGGLFGGIAAAAAFGRVATVDPLGLSDLLMQGLFIAYAVGRIGCLTYGCCHGRASDSCFRISYVSPLAKVNRLGGTAGIDRHPVQLYAALHGVLVAALVNVFAAGSVPAGTLTAIALVTLGLGRLVTEHYRERERPVMGLFTLGQLGAFCCLLGGWVLLFLLRPGPAGPSPSLWSPDLLVRTLPAWPGVFGTTVVVLLVYGVHWKRIGTWTG